MARRGRLGASARGDAAQRNDPGKVVCGSEAGIAHNGGAPPFAPIVSGWFALFGNAAGSAATKAPADGSKQLALIFLERQHVVAAALEHRCGKGAMAMQRIGRNNAAFEVQQIQYLQGAGSLVATRGLALSQAHSRLRCPDVDHVQRRTFPAPLEGPAQGFAVDRHHPAEVQPVELGECRHEPLEYGLEGLWVQQTEHPTERVVAGDLVLQPKEQSKQPFLAAAKRGHVRGALGASQRRRERNDQNFQQVVPRVVRPWVLQPPKSLLEFLHATPPVIWERSHI